MPRTGTPASNTICGARGLSASAGDAGPPQEREDLTRGESGHDQDEQPEPGLAQEEDDDDDRDEDGRADES